MTAPTTAQMAAVQAGPTPSARAPIAATPPTSAAGSTATSRANAVPTKLRMRWPVASKPVARSGPIAVHAGKSSAAAFCTSSSTVRTAGMSARAPHLGRDQLEAAHRVGLQDVQQLEVAAQVVAQRERPEHQRQAREQQRQ